MTFSSDQRAVLKRATNLPRNIETIMDAFSDKLTPEERDDPQYAFRVNFMPLLANRPAGADQVIEFAKGTPGDAAASIAVIKEVDRRKYGARWCRYSLCRTKNTSEFKSKIIPSYGNQKMPKTRRLVSGRQCSTATGGDGTKNGWRMFANIAWYTPNAMVSGRSKLERTTAIVRCLIP